MRFLIWSAILFILSIACVIKHLPGKERTLTPLQIKTCEGIERRVRYEACLRSVKEWESEQATEPVNTLGGV